MPTCARRHLPEILRTTRRSAARSAIRARVRVEDPQTLMTASTLQLIILPAGIIAVLFALYLARDVLSRDTGTKEMQDVAGTIFEGAVAFIRRQYTTIGILAVVGAVVIGAVITIFETKEVADTEDLRPRPRLADRPGVPRRRRLLDGVRDHRHVHQRQGRTSGRPRPPGAASSRRSRSRCAAEPSRASSSSPCRCSASTASSRLFGGLVRRPGDARRAVPHRRLRLRRLVRGPVRPARRRHLHQGRRRRLGPRRQGREGHPRGRSAQRGRRRGPRRRQRRRLRRPRRGPVRVDRRREHRRDDPRRRRLHDRPGRRLAEPPGLDLLPARRPRLRPAVDDRRDLLRPRQGRREPDEHAQPRLLGHDDPVRRRRCSLDDERDAPDERQRARRACRSGCTSSAPASSAWRRASPSSTSPSSTRRARSGRSARSPRRRRPAPRRTSSRGTAVGFETTFVTAITIGIALFASHWLGSQAGLINADGKDVGGIFGTAVATMAHADDDRLHPRDGHVRPDHRQRRRHRRVQPGRGRRPRDHRPARRRRQHDEGPDEGLRDRLGVAGRVPAVQRLHRQGQPDPDEPRRARLLDLGQPGQRQRLRRGA